MKITAVLITYKPDLEKLKNTLLSINSQISEIIIVNNGDELLSFPEINNVSIITLGENKGIAFAQNIGINKAIDMKSDFILISDQDTIYPSDYIASFEPFINQKLADVYCPVFYDNVKNVYSPIMIEKFKSIPKIDKPTYVEHAIASGTLINKDCFKKAGLMDEALFIDYVDFEWCWRATSNGCKIITIPNAVIDHQLGDGVKKILHKQVTLRSNIRYYYILRNGFYLCRYCKYLNKQEKKQLRKRTISFSLGVFLLKHNMQIVKLVFQAYNDGKKMRLGKKELK